MKKILISLILLYTTIWGQVETQAIYFTSDDDIWASYYRGELTYEQTIELIDLYETKVDLNSGDLSRLLSIPGFDINDLKKLEDLRAIKSGWKNLNAFEKDYDGDFELIMPFVRISPLKPQALSGEFYLYNYAKYKDLNQSIVTTDSVDEHGEYYTIIDTIMTYYPPKNSMSFKLVSKKYGNLSTFWEQSGQNSIIMKRRSYNISRGSLFLVLGNFNYSFGEGVLVGRYPTISTSLRNHFQKEDSKINDKIAKYYLTPKDGWMNGLYFTTKYKKISPALIISRNDFSEIATSIVAGKVEYLFDKKRRVGLAYAHADGSKRIRYGSDGLSMFFYAPFGKDVLEGEFAFFPRAVADTVTIKNQFGIVIKTSRAKDGIKMGLELWHYSKDFTNMYAYTLADPDYYYTYLGDTLKNPYKYYNRYKGESGGQTRTEISFGSLASAELKIRYSIDRLSGTSNFYTSSSITIYPSFLNELTLTYSLTKDSLTIPSYYYDYYKLYLTKKFGEKLELRSSVQLSTKLSSTYGYYHSTYNRIELRVPVFNPLLFKASFKWSDPNFEKKADGYFETTAEENIEFAGLEFSIRYDLRKYEQKTTNTQHTFRFNLRYNF